jgi:hypothetical protein
MLGGQAKPVKVIVFHLDIPCYQGTDSTKSTVVLIFFRKELYSFQHYPSQR